MSSIDYTTDFGAVAYFLGKDTDLKLKGKISLEEQGRIYQLKKNLSNVLEQKILIDLLNGIRFNAIEIIKKKEDKYFKEFIYNYHFEPKTEIVGIYIKWHKITPFENLIFYNLAYF